VVVYLVAGRGQSSSNDLLFTKLDSVFEAMTRFWKNSSYFRVNYVCIIALIISFSLPAHPFSLILLLCLAASWLFLYLFRPSDRPLILIGRSFSEYETLGGLILSTIAVIFFTSVGSVLISALMIGITTIPPLVDEFFVLVEDSITW